MDIASILAAADEEVTYEQDAFESVPHIDEDKSTKSHGGPPAAAVTVSDVLKSAAQAVHVEERKETAKILTETAEQVKADVEEENRQREEALASPRSPRDVDGDMKLLLEASDEVAALHDTSASALAAQSESAHHEGKEDDHEMEDIGETDEDQEDEDDDEEDYDADATLELRFAVCRGQSGKVEALLKKKANLLQEDRHGWNCVHWAASRGYLDVMEVLLEHHKRRGKRLRPLLLRRDSKLAGWTPLHIAAVCGHLDMAKLLLSYGASRRRKDHMGEYPFEVIGKGRHAKALLRLLHPRPHLLPDAGADTHLNDTEKSRRRKQ